MAAVVGLDVGGANTKAAVVNGDGQVRVVSEPYEVWRDLEAIAGVIAGVVGRLGLDGAPVALTTTAELVDVFPSKREGVLHVLDATRQALPGRRLHVMTTGGALVSLDTARAAPLACAAANWMATAMVVARALPDAILVDCGGTTTDVIPIAGGTVVAEGRTDLERLLAGELVYTGALRTSIAAVLSHVPIGGRLCPVTAELFAIAADAHLLRGNLAPEQCTCSFPDDRGTSPDEVRSRLARVVCADPEQLADGDLEAIAAGVEEAQLTLITAALRRVAARLAPDVPVVAVGVGAFLAREAAAALWPARSTPTTVPASRSQARAERSPPRSRCRCSAVSEPGPLVVKVGGGLLRDEGLVGLRRACAEVSALAAGRRVLVVPGGGPFADAVRAVDVQVGLGDDVAHALALGAMDQLGALLAPLLPGAERLTTLVAPGRLGLVTAARAFADRPEVPQSWAVTSDSLAVLAAAAVGGEEAVLLKPVAGILARWPSDDPPVARLTAGELQALQDRGGGRAVDPYLPEAVRRTGVAVVVRGSGPSRPAGTRIVPG